MKPPYRVQEYIFDMGVYHKQQIIDGVSHKDYSKRNVYHNNFYVILSPEDTLGKKLPRTVCSESERVDLVRDCENRIN